MGKKLSSAGVKSIIQEIHGDKYDLSEFLYVNRRTKFTLKCEQHGSWLTLLDQVIRGQGCPICGKTAAAAKRRVSFEDFLDQAREVHGNKYSYYKDRFVKISGKTKINCPIHGDFEQMADTHIRQGSGCPDCGFATQVEKRKMSLEDFILKSESVHGKKYEYSKVIYTNSRKKIIVICPEHGEFYPAPGNFLSGSGCPKCSIIEQHENQKKNVEDFINDSIKVHGDKYDYSKVVYYGGKSLVEITCKKHGLFRQTPNNHQRGNGCPSCNTSKGENLIKLILSNLEIEYITQHTFDGLVDKRRLKCDFYLPNNNLVIEYNGRQHYEEVKSWGGESGLNEVRRRDELKRIFFKTNQIRLLEIHFSEKDLENLIIRNL
jgi:ssDNA-binding Zn-finger/Zn-ribbon topoisomerase 1